MSSVLQFYIQMKDMMSSGLVKIAKTGVSSFAEVEGAMKKVQQHSEQVKSKNDILGSSYDMLQKKARELESTISSSTSVSNIRAARQELSSLQRDMGKHAGRPGKEGGILDLLPVAAIGYGAKELISGSLEQAATAENQKIAFKVLMGSEKEGGQLYGDIRKLADVTPFESTSLMRSGKMMLGFGEDKKKIMPDLNMLGNVAAGQDDPTQALLGLSHAYGEVIAEGKLMGKNTLEMINWGFNPLKEISLMTGKSMSELTEAERDGAITADMVRDAFAHATGEGGKFNNMMAQQAETLSGKWSTFMDLTHAKMRTLGEVLSPVAKLFMDFASSILNSNLAMIALAISGAAILFLLVKTALGIGQIQKAMQLLAVTIKTNPATIWIAAIGIAIALLLPYLDKLFTKTQTALDVYKQTTNVVKLKNDVDKEALSLASDNISKANKYVSVLKDLHATEKERTAALTDLKNLNKDYFGDLSLGKNSIEDATKALQNYTSAIIAHSKAEAASGRMTEIWKGYFDEETKVNKEATKIRLQIGGDAEHPTYMMPDIANPNSNNDKLIKANQDKFANTKLLPFQQKRDAALMELAKMSANDPMKDKDTKTQGAAVGEETDSIGRSTVSGGPRVININGVKFMDKLEMHVTNLKEDLKDVEEVFENMFLRVLNSGATVQ